MSLENQVKTWADHIHNVQDVGGFVENDTLDTEYVINSQNEITTIRLLVTFGGPNIWVELDGVNATIEGYWGGDKVIIHVTAPIELWEYLYDLR